MELLADNFFWTMVASSVVIALLGIAYALGAISANKRDDKD